LARMMDEKRTTPRITTVVPVNCRVTGHGTSALPSMRSESQKGSEFPARTINVSKSGMLIHCDSDITAHSIMEISLNAPTDGHPVKLVAEVAWSRRNSINLFGHYSAGLMIRKISEKDRSILTNFFKTP